MNSESQRRPRIAYVFSRYPVVSQTFCDSEMLALEEAGFDITIGSFNPPLTPFRHERYDEFQAEVLYPPPSNVLKSFKELREADGTWEERFGEMIARHDSEYGADFKPAIRARNALYFARQLERRGVDHIHVHFANRATVTALFIKQWAGIPFSFTAHAQDFMVDLGSDDLLRELCREAEFVIGVSDYSTELLRKTCPDSADKISRIYNGIAMDQFPAASISGNGPLRILSIGRLIEFKGFHHLIGACAQLEKKHIDYRFALIGEGPWRDHLEDVAADHGLEEKIEFLGVQSQEQVKQRLVESDVFCLPCIVDRQDASDILPTVITEAMACSLPVVSTRLVGVPEMVEDGRTGLLVEPGDETELADALAKLAGNREMARQFGEAGRARAEEIFELKTTAGQLARKFRESIQPRTAADQVETSLDSIFYLVDTWPPVPNLAEEIAFSITECPLDITPLSARAERSAKCSEIPDWPARVEFLPDAIVLESEWETHPGDAEQILEWRRELGTGIDTEEFIHQARRALHLARLIHKRGIRHVHGAEAGTAVSAWLVHRLNDISFSFAAARDTGIASSVFDHLTREAVLFSRGDTNNPEHDLLRLRPEDRTRRMVLGPLKVRIPGEKPLPDRQPVYRDWFEKLAEALAV